ncbi:hypothetical protein [Bradyrhizobium sacchari]
MRIRARIDIMTATDLIVARGDLETCTTIATARPAADALPADALP